MSTHREARTKLGSRQVRRAGIRRIRGKAGQFRTGNKSTVAFRVKQLIAASVGTTTAAQV